MTNQPAKLEHPDFNLEAILALLRVLLGFLFIVVIYVLENPQEILSTWGMPLVIYLLICYSIGLTIIASIISFEINFYLANKTIAINPEDFPLTKFSELKEGTQSNLRRSIKLLMYFIFSFGLFLINLAGFTAAKLLYSYFIMIEDTIIAFWGPLALLFIRMLVMFVVQFILIIPFASYQGNLWSSYKTIEQFQLTSNNPEQ